MTEIPFCINNCMAYLYRKFRLKPSKEQETKLVEHCDAARFIFNTLLEEQIKMYEESGIFMFGMALPARIKSLRKEHEFLKLVNSQSLQQAAMNLGTAFKNRFKHKHTGFPKFKSRRNNRQTFMVPQHFAVKKNMIRLPKIGWIKMIQHRKLVGKVKSMTIVKDIDLWHVSILCEVPDEASTYDPTNIVGIDVGIKTFAITSDGEVFDMPKFKDEIKKLKSLQRKHAKKKRDSNNRDKARIKVAKQYRKLTRKKTDRINNIVATITKCYDVVSVENLNINGMKKNRRLAPAIQQLPWGQFKSKLKEKAKYFHEVSRWYPSSKTCSCCGWIKKNLSLGDRIFSCDSCGFQLDRDLNAAINLRTVATAGIVCGGSSGGDEKSSSHDLMKQEYESVGIQAINALAWS